jgi:hypothetical protein
MRYFASVVAAIGFFHSAAIMADTPLVNFSAADINPAFNNSFSNGAGGFDLGYKFHVTNSITITQLGYYDDFGDGMIGSHAVGLYKADGTNLATATINPSDTLDGVFRYASISEVTLAPGDYVLSGVAGYDPGNPVDNYTHDPFSIAFDPNIVFLGNRVKGQQANNLIFLTDADTEIHPTLDYGWFGPNAKVKEVAVPEPATMLSLLTMGALALKRRRKQKVA